MEFNFNAEFNKVFGREATKTYFSPGRINLIGEHIDYSGGLVMPCAISFGTYGSVALRNDKIVRLYSYNFSNLGMITIDLDQLELTINENWTRYIVGVLILLKQKGHQINQGFDFYIYGNIPNGAGLSSSASLEMMTAFMLKDMFNLNLDELEMIQLGAQVENDFLGLDSGIMDQFAVVKGRDSSAMLLNTNSLDFEYVPLILGEYEIVIMNTNKRRDLNESKYNERTKECVEALEILSNVKKREYLCDYGLLELNESKHLFCNYKVFNRARHAITENMRTLAAAKALSDNNLQEFGKLMTASHVSLRDDYEVTGIELDTIVDLAMSIEGVLGARVTGAGFGGCAIAVVPKSMTSEFIEQVSESYRDKIGYSADFYIASPSEGAHEIK